MKSVSPDALAVKVFGDRIVIRDGGVRAMKRRVEAGDLNQLRADLTAASEWERGYWVDGAAPASCIVPSAPTRLDRRQRADRSPDRRERRDGRRRPAATVWVSRNQSAVVAIATLTSAISCGAYDLSTSGDPSRVSARNRGCVPMPSNCPLMSRGGSPPSGSPNIWNLTLEDPALTTRIASMSDHAAGTAIEFRRAAA